MKKNLKLFLAAIGLIVLAGCGSLSYKKMKTGVVYKIFAGNSKDSLPHVNNVIKFNIVRKFNDSVIYDSYDKMPVFIQLTNFPETDYNPFDVLHYMRKGDSAVVIEMYDTLVKKGLAQQLPFTGKKGDRITNYIRILEVYRSDSLARVDYNMEMEKDRPRQEKEMADMQAKMAREKVEQQKREMEEWKKSGEIDRELKEIETYLAAKNITAQKTEKGTYVLVQQKGSGAPVADEKFMLIKYAGKLLPSDSAFESGSYVFQMGKGEVISGWEDGLKFFNEGGAGVLYIPGYLGYGKNPGPGGKAFQSMRFDVEVLKVSDNQADAYAAKQVADSIDAVKNKTSAKK